MSWPNSTYGYFTNIGADATKNVKPGPGRIMALTCHNANAAARYLQVHNTITVPSAAAVPALVFLVPAGSQIIVGTDFFGTSGVEFSTGVAFAFSTTRDTYTAGTNTDQNTTIIFS
jgi:hypothetical protein